MLVEKAINLQDQQLLQIASKLSTLSIHDLCLCRALELERLQLTYGIEKHIVDIQSPARSAFWYVSHGSMENSVETIHQRACDLDTLQIFLKDQYASDTPELAISLHFLNIDCNSLVNLIDKVRPLLVRSVVILNCSGTLSCAFLAALKSLKYLVIANTKVDVTNISFPFHFSETLEHLVMSHCEIDVKEVPSEIGKLKNLKLLNVTGNGFRVLPKRLSSLQKLDTLLLDTASIAFPPAEVLSKSVRDITQYLDAIQQEPVKNNKAKLIVVGQEGVGKSTLIKGIGRSYWFGKTGPPSKTDGVEISSLILKDIQCKVYDLAGDVEYLNTHSLFLSSGCLHFVVFDLSQFLVSKGTRSADHFCRLELWLQTIASQDPNSYVLIVGTHADHPLISKEILTRVRDLLLKVLTQYHPTHLAASKCTLFEECILCNPDRLPYYFKFTDSAEHNKSSNESANAVSTGSISHILGYFEVSSITKYPQTLKPRNINLELLKSSTAFFLSNLMKLTGKDSIPTRWVSFRKCIMQMLATDDKWKQQPVVPLCVIEDIAFDTEIFENEMIVAMLRFFHSQGELLWYEDLPQMKEVVIIDPQWMSEQLCMLISHRCSVSCISDGILKLADFLKYELIFPKKIVQNSLLFSEMQDCALVSQRLKNYFLVICR